MTDISSEAVEAIALAPWAYASSDIQSILIALRATLDAADADKRQAVMDERERCAKIADAFAKQYQNHDTDRGIEWAHDVGWHGGASYIAAAIREGEPQ